jgi:hypothetical protein
MRTTLKSATVAIALAGLSLVGVGAANADDAFDVSKVVAGYADGYVGADQQFHAWEHRADAEEYRAKHGDQYRAWRHDDPRHKNDE